MAKKWKKAAAAVTALVMASSMAVSLTACDPEFKPYDIEKKARTGWKDEKVYTFNDYSTAIPSDWNDLSTVDGAARDIYGYTESSLIEFDFKFNADGSVKPGEYDVIYSGATNLEDVTTSYIGQYGVERIKHSLKKALAYKDVNVKLKWGMLEEGETVPDGCTAFDVEEDGTTYHLYYKNADVPADTTVEFDDDGFPYYVSDVPEGHTSFTVTKGEGDAAVTYTLYYKDADVPADKTVAFDANGLPYYLLDAPEGATVLGEGAGSYYETDPVGRAFKYTLRNDLKWDDGTAIKAADFVYSMQQQLSPDFKFEKASNYYSGNYVLHNSEEYLKQSSKTWEPSSTVFDTYADSDHSKMYFNIASPAENKDKFGSVVSSFRTNFGVPASWDQADLADYVSGKTGASADDIIALCGKTLAEIEADDTLNATWDAVIGWWQTDPDEELDFFVAEYTWPSISFNDVGFFATSDYEFVVVFDNVMTPFKADGGLSYEAGYYFSGWPLVKKDLWESTKKSPVAGSSIYTTTYNSGSVANAASWGPYKLTNYQAGTTYTLERNDNWYGYKMSRFDDQYQTDRIVVRQIKEYQTALESFLLGEISAIGIDSTVSNQYRGSSQAYFSQTDQTFSLHLQSKTEALTKEKGNALLKYDEFRMALALSIDRDNYAQTLTTSSVKALGLMNEEYYYDVENGGVYRNSTQGKEALLKAYGATKGADGKWTVGVTKFEDIDSAVDALTGYNPALASQLMTEAYNKALANRDIDAGGTVTLTFGGVEENANFTRRLNYIQNAFSQVAVGTPLEGKINVKFYQFSEATWSDEFENGDYDLCQSAWYQANFNPYYFIGCYVQDNNRFATGWDPNSVHATLDIAGGDGLPSYAGLELTIQQWYDCVNGAAGAPYNFKVYPVDDKLNILAAIESAVLESYYVFPIYSAATAALMSYKCDYITYEKNTFMGFGGIQYLSYNFDDTEWEAFCKEHGTLNYKY